MRALPPVLCTLVALALTALATGGDPIDLGARTSTAHSRWITASMDLETIALTAGPELGGLALEVAEAALSPHRARLEAWLCEHARAAGGGSTARCPSGGVFLRGPSGPVVCSVHGGGGATPAGGPPRPRRGASLGRTLAALRRVSVAVRFDDETMRPDPATGRATIETSYGANLAARLGLPPPKPDEGEDVGLGDTPPPRALSGFTFVLGERAVRVGFLADARGVLDARWAPEGGPVTAAAVAPPAEPAGEGVLVRLQIPIGPPIWDKLQARMPMGVSIGRPPEWVRIAIRRDSIEMRFRHESEDGVIALDSNLAAGLTVLKVATAFKRKDAFDYVLEYLFRAPRRKEENDLVLEGEWPPELKRGVAWALESAVEHGPAPDNVTRAACRLRRLKVERAVASFESERGAPPGPLARLVDEGYIDAVPPCPLGGAFEVRDGVARCAAHPAQDGLYEP